MKNREEGYYWVKMYGEWEVAHWLTNPLNPEPDNWRINGTDLTMCENEFDEIGPKIEPPHDKHQCSFRNVKNKYGKEFGMCSCGALLCKEGTFSQEDVDKMREQMRTPGAVFEVVKE